MDTSSVEQVTGETVVSLVGDFEVRHNGVVVRVPPIAQRVLCFIAIQDQPVRRSSVTGNLWPEADERRASARLRSALWRIPAFGDQPMLRTSSTHIWLDQTVTVDLHALMREGASMFDEGSPRLERADVAHALRAYGRDVLTGWYEDWAVFEGEHFRQVRLRVLDRLGALLFDDGRYQEALEVALVVVACDPLHEGAQRLLVRVHLAEGNVAQAFRVYGSYAQLLHRELGAAPSPVMTGLLEPYRCRGSTLRTSRD